MGIILCDIDRFWNTAWFLFVSSNLHCKTLPKINCGFHKDYWKQYLLTLLNLAYRMFGLIRADAAWLIGLIQARLNCYAAHACRLYNKLEQIDQKSIPGDFFALRRET